MVTSPQIANDIATSVLGHRSFQAAALLLRETEGHYNQYGEWVEGAAVETAVSLVHAPISGQQRLTLEAGLRDEDVRTFWLLGDHPSLRYSLTDGDRFVLGALGTGQNRFDGTTRVIAERMTGYLRCEQPDVVGGVSDNDHERHSVARIRASGVPTVRCNGRALGGRRPIPRNACVPLGRVYGSNGRAARSGECVMLTFRCKCGARVVYTSMSVPDCQGCHECNTTFAGHPSNHKALISHDFQLAMESNDRRIRCPCVRPLRRNGRGETLMPIKVCIKCWALIEWVSAGTLDKPYHIRCWNERHANT